MRERTITFASADMVKEISLVQYLGDRAGLSKLDIKTTNEGIVRLFESKGGIRKSDGALIEASSETITELLTDAFQIAGIDIASIKDICGDLGLPEPYPKEPFSPEASKARITSRYGFFSAAGAGAGAGAIATSLPVHDFLQLVAEGKQDEADALLKATSPSDQQILLRTPGVFTDYSGRTFNCTAAEYAYWAGDTRMCHMLESLMNEETKAQMLSRFREIEDVGLSYTQAGSAHCSTHFDLTPLKTALQTYTGTDVSARPGTSENLAWKTALKAIGNAQREVPAHIAQTLCCTERPLPVAPETLVSRSMAFDNSTTHSFGSWFPLVSPTSGLGFDFAIINGIGVGCAPGEEFVVDAIELSIDSATEELEAINQLDERITADLRTLNPMAGPAMPA